MPQRVNVAVAGSRKQATRRSRADSQQNLRAEGPVAAPLSASMIVVTALPVSEISPNDYNPNQMTDKAVKIDVMIAQQSGGVEVQIVYPLSKEVQ